MNTPIQRALMILIPAVLWHSISLTVLHAQESGGRRPQIGLALSGGGARGAAHIGVLKALERAGIHIDCIAGTSFGAIVGGLYATGYSADEVEAIVVGSNWQEVLSNQPERAKAPLLQGRSLRQLAHINLQGLSPMIPLGLLRGQKLMELVNRYTVKQMVAAEYDFDRLPIRFRAVSTDLLTGQTYIFKKGRMSEALRASSALPLIFTPWPKDGMMLVDGSMSNNLPADIVRDLGADIVIAVDVTAPDLKYQEVRNALNVYAQCLGLMMKQTVKSHYRYADIVIRPDLNGYGNSNYGQMREIVGLGANAAAARISEIRAHMGSPWVENRDSRHADNPGPVIDSISFTTNGGAQVENYESAYLLKEVTSKPREKVRPEQLAVDTQRLYATGLFENVDYELQRISENRYRLRYDLMESSSNTLGVSLRYDRDYKLQALMEFSSRDLFRTRSYATISSRLGSAVYHSATLRLIHPRLPVVFLEPQLHWLKRDRLQFHNHKDVGGFIDQRRGAQISAGVGLNGRFEASVGFRFETVSFSPDIQHHPIVQKTNLGGLRLHVRRDTLDAQEFPTKGMLLDIQGDERSIDLASDLNQGVWQGNMERYLPVSDKTALSFRLAAMKSRGDLLEYEKAYLGGYGYSDSSSLRLVGFARDELSVDRFALAGAGLRRLLLQRPMSFIRRGFLTLEYNLAAISEKNGDPSGARVIHGAALGFSFDTMVGPLRIAAGIGDANKVRVYFSVGPSF